MDLYGSGLMKKIILSVEAGLLDYLLILSVPFCPYHFVRTILSVPFCPVPFCPRTHVTIIMKDILMKHIILISQRYYHRIFIIIVLCMTLLVVCFIYFSYISNPMYSTWRYRTVFSGFTTRPSQRKTETTA